MEVCFSILFSRMYSRKALQGGLGLIWLFGIFLVGISFYATQMLSSSFKEHIKQPKPFSKGSSGLNCPTITMFTAPEPFTGLVGERQSLAIRSWIGLSQKIDVVLFSQDPSVFTFADSFGSQVTVEPNIDFTFVGTPFFNSMVARALASSSEVSVLIDPITLLLPDFLWTLKYVHKLDQDWLLFASSQNISHFPFHLDPNGQYWAADNSKRIGTPKLQEFLSQRRHWKHCNERMLLAWNNGNLPLHKGVLPPFLYGRGLHTHWIITEALSSDFRLVFDASWTISNFYFNNFDEETRESIEDSHVLGFEKRIWEYIGNSHLAMQYGSLYFREANYSNLFQFLQCDGNYHFLNAAQNIVYRVGDDRPLNLRRKGISLASREEEILDCFDVLKSVDKINTCPVKDQFKLLESISLPLSLDSLLSMRADKNKTIILSVAGYSYKEMLMSWVCRLCQIDISNFLVCALDNEVYEFSVSQGLPVIKYSDAPTNISFDDCHFGTECFQKVTKVKSRIVLHILKLGYNVLLSDVDMYWFKSPLPLLSSFGPAVLVAQSDEYNMTGPINLPRRLNSGFYFAHSDVITIAAFEMVVKHAARSNLSEQPSFYDTLCGDGGVNRIGDNKCLETQTNLTVHFLDRDLFPNGAYLGLWEEENVRDVCLDKGCFILHNNWISGRKKKLERQFGSTPDRVSRSRKELKEESQSFNISIQLKDVPVRIVHAGGRVELYQNEISASELMQKYPGMCVAWPDVFKRPHESLLSPGDMLVPGKKYYIIRSTTVAKLKRRHQKNRNIKDPAYGENPNLDSTAGEDFSDDSFTSAQDFYVSKETWANSLRKKCRKEKKPFVPPIQRPRIWKEPAWEPSLTSIKEMSP